MQLEDVLLSPIRIGKRVKIRMLVKKKNQKRFVFIFRSPAIARQVAIVSRRLRLRDAALNASAVTKLRLEPAPSRVILNPARVDDPDSTRGHIHMSGLRRSERRRLAAQMATALRDDGTCRDMFAPLWSSAPPDAFPTDTDPASMYAHAPPRRYGSSTGD